MSELRGTIQDVSDMYPVVDVGRYKEITGKVHQVTLEPRPSYCDRGHFIAKVFPSPDLGEDNRLAYSIDDGDAFPRYYMDETRAIEEIRAWLLWREEER